MDLSQQYIDFYKQASEAIKKHSASALNTHRDEAFQTFTELGFPTHRDENYLYCRVQEALDLDYGINVNGVKFEISREEAFQCNVHGIRSNTFYVINETFDKSRTHSEALPNGVVLCSMKEACEKYSQLVESHLNQLIKNKKDGFIAFNEMLSQDGYFLYVPDNVVADVPFQLIEVMRANADVMANTRNLIVIGKNAQARLLVCDHAIEKVNFFANRLTEIFVGENAHFDYYVLENTHEMTNAVSQVFVHQDTNSAFVGDFIGLHNGRTRNFVDIELNGENAETWLGGIVLDDKEQTTDNFALVRHNAAHCTSNVLYKYILDDKAEGGFSGIIIVEDGAQKTNAYQTNRNICLTRTAKMHAKPQLEIYADDVKCGHGATTGQLDDNALFYMQQRGIPVKEAKMLLMMAFTNDILEHVDVDILRQRLQTMVERRLRGEYDAKCDGCNYCD